VNALKSTERRSRARPTGAEKRAANRDRLLEAARTVFAERGYHGATIQAIVDESGLSNGALYYNFRNKEELFLALLDRRVEARVAAVGRLFEPGSASDAESDAAVREAALQGVRDIDDPEEWAMFFEFVAHAAREPAFGREFRKRARRLRRAFESAVEREVAARGRRLTATPEQAALGVAALAQGLAVQRIVDPRAIPDALLGELVVHLLRGMTVPGDDERAHTISG
jgi:AcrR family transcriptional regulator